MVHTRNPVGLVNNGNNIPIPLSGVDVSVKIVDFCAEVTISQRYVNKEANPIEAT
jgi:hypothetical protein